MYTIEKKTLTDIADAIREKTGKSDLILPGDMPGEIATIQSVGEYEILDYIDFYANQEFVLPINVKRNQEWSSLCCVMTNKHNDWCNILSSKHPQSLYRGNVITIQIGAPDSALLYVNGASNTVNKVSYSMQNAIYAKIITGSNLIEDTGSPIIVFNNRYDEIVRIYRIKIDDSVFLPCIRKFDNASGLWDCTNGSLLTSAIGNEPASIGTTLLNF